MNANTRPIDSKMLTETGPHHFVTEASALGLRPGAWPMLLGVAPTFGNGQPLVKTRPTSCGWCYIQDLGCIDVEVIND